MNESRFRSMVVAMISDLDGQGMPIETSDSAGEGVPDVELCLPGGRQAWLELKVARYRVRTQTLDLKHLRRLQARWLRTRWRLGGPCGLLIRCEETAGSALGYALLDGEDAGRLFLDVSTQHPWTWDQIYSRSYLPQCELDAHRLKTAVKALSMSAYYSQRPPSVL